MIINPTTLDLLMKTRGLTQAALADRARVGVKTIGRIRRSEELRGSNAEKIANALGVSLDTLMSPPSEKLAEVAGKTAPLDRLVSDLSVKALNAVKLTALRYGIPEKTVLEAGPYMLTLLAELSLKRRRMKIEAWKDAALAAVEQGPSHEENKIELIKLEILELYDQEIESIERRDLSGGFEGVRDIDELSVREDGKADHAFFRYLDELSWEAGIDLGLQPWSHVSLKQMMAGQYSPYSETIEELLGHENGYWVAVDVLVDIESGNINLKEFPEELWREENAQTRFQWAEKRFGPLVKKIEDTAAENALKLGANQGVKAHE